MDRYNNKQCLVIEQAIDDIGIPSHVEINDGILSITYLGLRQVTQEHSNGGTTTLISLDIED